MVFINALPGPGIAGVDDAYAYDDATDASPATKTKQGRPGQWQITDTLGIEAILDDAAIDNTDSVNFFQLIDENEDFNSLLRFRIRPQGKMEQEPVHPELIANSLTSGLTTAIGPSFVADNKLYVAADPCYSIYDTTIKNNPTLVRAITGADGVTYDISETTAVHVHRNIIMTTFLGAQGGAGGGILLYDLFDEKTVPDTFTLIENQDTAFGLVPSLETVYDFVAWGNFNFYPDFANDKITVVNVSDLFAPVVVAVYEDGVNGFVIDKPASIDISNGVLYWSNTGVTDKSIRCAQLAGTNISVTSPVTRGSFDLSGGGNVQKVGNLEARGTHVIAGGGNNFFAGDDEFLYSINFNDLDTPILSDKIAVSDQVTQIQYDENIVSVSSRGSVSFPNILTMIDSSDLTDLKIASVFDDALADLGLGHGALGNEIYLVNSNGSINLAVIDIQGFKTQSIEAAHGCFGNVSAATRIITRRLAVTDNADFGAAGISSAGTIRGGVGIATVPASTNLGILTSDSTVDITMAEDAQAFRIEMNQAGNIVIGVTGEITAGHVAYARVKAFSAGAGRFEIETGGRIVTVGDIGPTGMTVADQFYYITFKCFVRSNVFAITAEIKEEF